MDDSSNIQQSEQTIEQNEIIQNKTNEQNNEQISANYTPPPSDAQTSEIQNQENTNSKTSNILNNQLYIPVKIPNQEQIEKNKKPEVECKNKKENIDDNIQYVDKFYTEMKKKKCCCCYCCLDKKICKCNSDNCYRGCDNTAMICCLGFADCCKALQ